MTRDLGGVGTDSCRRRRRAYGVAFLRGELRGLRAAGVGTRNHRLNQAAFVTAQVVAGGEFLQGARSFLLATALAIGLAEPEARSAIDSAFAAGVVLPRLPPQRRF
jgi:hypothetical protein